MSSNLFELNKVYTFNTLSPVFLGTKMENLKAKIVGCNAGTARRFASIDHMWATIYPSLPAGTVNDVERSVFYLFEAQNGSEVVMCDKWIDPSSIRVIEHIQITVSFPTANLGDADLIRNALNSAGLKDYAITVS